MSTEHSSQTLQIRLIRVTHLWCDFGIVRDNDSTHIARCRGVSEIVYFTQVSQNQPRELWAELVRVGIASTLDMIALHAFCIDQEIPNFWSIKWETNNFWFTPGGAMRTSFWASKSYTKIRRRETHQVTNLEPGIGLRACNMTAWVIIQCVVML